MLKDENKIFLAEESSEIKIENVKKLRIIENKFRRIFNKYNITEILMSSFDDIELYKKVYDDFDDYKVFKYIGNQGRVISLRWDYTIPIARYYSMLNTNDEARFSYFGKEYRKEKKYKGRNVEEYQAGIELINVKSNGEEICLRILQETLSRLKLNNLILELGSARLFNRICELTNDKEKITEILSKKNISEMQKFVKEKKLDNNLSKFLLKLPRLCGNIEMLDLEINEVSDKNIKNILLELKEVYEKIPNKDYVIFDLSMCPTMEYYTGVVFKVYHKNAPGPLVCGGRYDLLYKKLGNNSKAIGMSYYFSNILKSIEKRGNINYDKNSCNKGQN